MFSKITKIEHLPVFSISSRNHRPRNVFVPDSILEIYAAVVSRAQLYHIPPLPSLCCGRVVAGQLPQGAAERFLRDEAVHEAVSAAGQALAPTRLPMRVSPEVEARVSLFWGSFDFGNI